MSKRVTMIGIAAISAVLMLRAEANAQWLFDVQFVWSSIECNSILKGLSKKASASTLVECVAAVREFTFHCDNNGGNAENANSHNFQSQNSTATTLTSVSQCSLDKVTGDWKCQQVITDGQLQAELAPLVDPALFCPNAQWQVNIDVVTAMDARVNVFSCKNASGNACAPGTPGCFCDTAPGSLQDSFCATCSLPGLQPAPYNCTERELATCPVQ